MITRWLLLLILLVPCVATAQTSLHVTGLRRTGNVLSANVIAFNPDGTIARPATIDVLHNGTWRSVTVQCPRPVPPVPLSSVLAVDVSGSMAHGGPNIDLAITAARAWIDALSDESECAITAFDHTARLISDFSSDTSQLSEALNTLVPRGGTDYAAGFNHAVGGAFSAIASARNRRVIVFLSDGFGGGNADSIIATAKAANTTVYCVTLGLAMPDVLRRVAEETGGLWFQNVTTRQQATLAYRRIMAAATSSPCTIAWNAPLGCATEEYVKSALGTDTVSSVLAVADSLIGGVTFSPASVAAGLVPSGQNVSRMVTVRATGSPVTITGMRLDGPATMRLAAPSLPITLLAGDSIIVGVTVESGDTAYTLGRIEFASAPCPIPPLYISAGSPGMPPVRPTIRVVHPNGGERFFAGETVALTYSGVPPNDPVSLEVSTDLGATWTVANESATGGRFLWQTPLLHSDSCLLRATQRVRPDPQGSTPQLVLRGEKLDDVSFSPDGTLIVTSGWEKMTPGRTKYGQVRIWDASSGREIRQLDAGYHHMFTSDGRKLLTWGEDDVMLWDVATGKRLWLRNVTPTNGPVTVQIASREGSILVVGGWGDTTLVLDATTGDTKMRFPRADKAVRWATIDDAASMVAVCEQDSAVRVYDARTGTLLSTIADPAAKRYYKIAFQPGGRLLAVASGEGASALVDPTTGQMVRKLATRQYVNDNTYLAFSADGQRIAVETGRDQSKIFDVNTGKELVAIQRANASTAFNAVFSPNGQYITMMGFYQASIFDASTGVLARQVRRAEGVPAFAPDHSRFAIVAEERAAEVHPLLPVALQADVSDARWSIVQPAAVLRPVRFAQRFVGQSVDSLITAGLINNGPDTLFVRTLGVEGSQATSFGVRSKPTFTVPPGDTMAIELSFVPQKAGELAALLVATVRGGRLVARLTGPAKEGLIAADGGAVDLGSVHVGDTRRRTIQAISNTGGTPLVVERIVARRPDTTVFTVDSLAENVTLQPGDKLPIRVAYMPKEAVRSSMSVDVYFKGIQDPVELVVTGRGDTIQPYRDPTTFRMVMLPSSVLPRKGSVITGVYAGIGLMAGYALTDHVMLLAGGVLPLPNRWLGVTGPNAATSSAMSVGIKAGGHLSRHVTLAGGWQFGKSTYDQEFSAPTDSRITFNAVWSSVGYGTDDSRFNAMLGYAFKRHETAFNGNFNADAIVLALGYDKRIGDQWKICGEALFMRSMTFVPINLMARWFNNNHALEAGLTVTGIPASGAEGSSFPVVPMVSWVMKL